MSEEVFCSNCGHRNLADDNFCSACGTRLAAALTDDLTLTLHPLTPAGEPSLRDVKVRIHPDETVLILERGDEAGLTFTLVESETTIGRNPTCEIFLDDVTVSRKHATIRHLEGGGFEIQDAGSLNGTYVNAERISSVALHSGDEVIIGKFRMLFVDAGQ
jgi:FHA domain/zinc-ribbon domain